MKRTLLWPLFGCLLPLLVSTSSGCALPKEAEHASPHGEREGGGEHDEHAGEGKEDEHDEGRAPEEGTVRLSPEAAKHAKIKVARVEARPVPFVLRTTARVAFDERRLAHVSPRISGRVLAVPGELGQNVEAGARLALLDSIVLGEAKADYLTARSEESLARKTKEREARLFAERITSEQAVMEATADHEKAQARLRASREKLRLLGLSEVEIAKVRYGDTSASRFALRAPISGRIVEKHAVVGELVGPEEKVFVVADLKQLWIWIDVYERDLARVHIGDTVEVITEAHPQRIFEGKVAYIRDEVDPDTRVIRARIDIPNTDGALKPGMFAEVVLTDPHGAASRREGLAVLPAAVQRDGSRHIAFVKKGERHYEQRVLRLGARTERLVEVIAGLSAGEEVVVEGTFLLKSEAAKQEMGGGHSH